MVWVTPLKGERQQATEAGTVCLSHLTAPSWQLALARMTEMEKVVDMFVFSLGMEAVGSNRGAILTVTQKTNAAVEVCLYQMMETSSQLELLAGTDLVTEIAACGFMRGTRSTWVQRGVDLEAEEVGESGGTEGSLG